MYSNLRSGLHISRDKEESANKKSMHKMAAFNKCKNQKTNKHANKHLQQSFIVKQVDSVNTSTILSA